MVVCNSVRYTTTYGRMIVGGTLEMRYEGGAQHPDAGVLERHLLVGGLELDRVELDRPALGLGRSRLQFHQHVLQRLIGKILLGVLACVDPGDVAGLVGDLRAVHALMEIGEINRDGVRMLLLGRLLMGSLLHAQDANPSVVDFDFGLSPGGSSDREDRQTQS